MRVSFLYQANRHQANLQNSLAKYVESQEKVIKNRGLLNPEDKPTNYTAAYSLQRTIDDMAQFVKNAEGALGWLNASENQIDEAVDITKKARELAIAGNVGHLTREASQALGKDVLNLYNRMYDLGNAQHMGRYIFSGFETNTQPFQDRKNSVSAITQYFGDGGDVSVREVYTDFTELKSGEYTVEVRMHDNKCYLSMIDEYGNKVMIDSNGSDDSLKSGNDMVQEMIFEYEPGKVLNTGIGITISLPKDPSVLFSGLKYTFKYEAGAADSYFGDNGVLYNKIGYNQHIPMNFTGTELFLKNNKILRSGQLTTATGVNATASTKFTDLHNANANIGDTISFRGLDYLGRPLGSATVGGSNSVTYDMRFTTEEERTLTFGYAGKYYRITVPAESYENMDVLLTKVERELARAKYAGSQTPMDYMGVGSIEANHHGEIMSLSSTPFEVDLSSQIKVCRDGDRLAFTTSSTGDHALLSVTGFKNNTLGFNSKTIAAQGRDTVFELGYDFKQQDIPVLQNNHEWIALPDLINGFTFEVNGKTVTVPALYESDPLMIKPELEYLIDMALNEAGFNHQVSARVTGALDGPMTLTFTMQNVSFTRDTHLATKITLPCKQEYLMSASPRKIPAFPEEKTIGDLMKFITELYKDTVDVTLDDGRINITDRRTGKSPMTLQITENHEGMSLPIVDNAPIVTGQYNGYSDDRWTVQYSVMPGIPETTRDVRIMVKNSKGQDIVDLMVMNYNGEPVELRNGISVVFDDYPVFDKVFELDLTANSSLNLGDMAIVSDGSNGNVFRNLMNLYKALDVGIGLDGADAPSQWRDENSRSSAIPSFENDFGGNFNAKWEYFIEPVDGKTDFYIQDEFVHTTGRLRYDPKLMDKHCNLAFTVQFYNEEQNKMISQDVCVPISIATSPEEIAKLVMEYINDEHPALAATGIRVVYNDGKLMFQSGSGERNINVLMNDSTTTYIMGIDETKPELSIQTDFSGDKNAVFDIRYFDGDTWQVRTVMLNQAYGTELNVLDDINAQLSGSHVKAVLDSSNILSFTSTTNQPYYYDILSDPASGLGFGNNIQRYIGGEDVVYLDTTKMSATARSLTFKYGLSKFSVELPAKEFNNIGEIVAEINRQITDKSFPPMFEAVAYGRKGIGFKILEPMILPISIEGDHEGSLGFKKRGDTVVVNVKGEDGESIQNVTMNKASKYYDVADGLKLAFDPGTLYAADSFTGAIGSGVAVELGNIDVIENQLLAAYTKVGNRVGKTEATKAFNQNVTTTSENQKAKELESRNEDLVNLAQKMEQAQSAYEYAMAVTSQATKFSIMDYMR